MEAAMGEVRLVVREAERDWSVSVIGTDPSQRPLSSNGVWPSQV
jgi:hypothetical protein